MSGRMGAGRTSTCMTCHCHKPCAVAGLMTVAGSRTTVLVNVEGKSLMDCAARQCLPP